MNNITKQAVVFACTFACARSAMAGTLLSFEFNGDNPWKSAATDVMPSTPMPIEPFIEAKAAGTVDVAGTADASGAQVMSAEVGAAKGDWEATFTSGLLPVKNGESNLNKLTLAFDLSVSTVRPVIVRVASFNAQKKLTGKLQTTVYPAAPDFFHRSVVDLGTMRAANGKFNSTDPFVQIELAIAGPTWPAEATHELRVDNVHYASPAFYVSPGGDDKSDGRTEKTALATPQTAVDQAKPGDIILLMDGTYIRPKTNSIQNGVIQFEGTGTPAAWITLKNYPGHKPKLFVDDAWHAIRIGGPVRDPSVPEKAVAYFEVRGLHVRGNADKVKQDHADAIGKPMATSNSNGMIVDTGKRTFVPHHIRMADNLVELCPGAGVATMGGDWITIENNRIYDNCWYMIYAGSGISLLETKNFDTAENVYKCLIRNNVVNGNRCYMPWSKIGKFSDGNGIIVDCNKTPEHTYFGRTLIQNNLSVNNGGSGIHCFKTHRIDIVNNTSYLSAATPQNAWGQIFVQRSDDVRVINNVMVARPGQPVNTVDKSKTDRGNTNVVRANNVYIGGGFPPIMGSQDVIADPMFVKPSTNRDADFNLRSGSPAIGKGRWDPWVPLTDIDGRPRPLDRTPDSGAYQK